jgi:hypothetical protein
MVGNAVHLVDGQHAKKGVHPQLGRNGGDADDFVKPVRLLTDEARQFRRELNLHREAVPVDDSDIEPVVASLVPPEVDHSFGRVSEVAQRGERFLNCLGVAPLGDLNRESNPIFLGDDEVRDLQVVGLGLDHVGACQGRSGLQPVLGVDQCRSLVIAVVGQRGEHAIQIEQCLFGLPGTVADRLIYDRPFLDGQRS